MASSFTTLRGVGAPTLAHEFKVMLSLQWIVSVLCVQEQTEWNGYCNCILPCGKCDMLDEKR